MANSKEIYHAKLKVEKGEDQKQLHKQSSKGSTTFGGDPDHTVPILKQSDFCRELHEKFQDCLTPIKQSMVEGCSKIYNIGNEGYSRKEIHFLCETENKIAVYQFKPKKTPQGMTFDQRLKFSFYKEDIGMSRSQTIEDMSINPTSDHEAMILVLKNDGELKFVNDQLLKLFKEVGEPPKNLTEFTFKRQNCTINEDTVVKDYVFRLRRFFMRRNFIYLESATGDMKRLDTEDLKGSSDPMSKAIKLPLTYAEAQMQDLTMHLNFYTDYMVANTTLILSHGKILSIYDFSIGKWEHIFPERMGGAVQQGCQAYFKQVEDEIKSLTLNHIFPYNTYDVFVEFKGSYIRRLKYYSETGKTYFEKKVIFREERVVQILKNEDTRNFRKFGDRQTRTIFLVQTSREGEDREYQIWVSQNGSRITKMVSKIKEEWRFLEIANSPSDLLTVYDSKKNTLICYMIQNCHQLLYPDEMEKYIKSKVTGFYLDKNIKKFFIFQNSLYFQRDGNLQILALTREGAARERTVNFGNQMMEIYMAHQDSVYYKDKNHCLNFANFSTLKNFNSKLASIQVFNCRGAFVRKITYGMFNNRLALFTSPFEITVLPALDRCRIDLMGSLDFEAMFVAYKEVDNKIIGLAKPNVIQTWSQDTGHILKRTHIAGMDLTSYRYHSDWHGQTILKKTKQSMAVEERQQIIEKNAF